VFEKKVLLYNLDHGCLSLSTPLLDFRQRFRADYKSLSPVLVHCRCVFYIVALFLLETIFSSSAGVGRSGTFIALDALLETAEHHDTIDVLDFTHRMR
jgi:protein-tyrosine phosphatase